MRALLRSVATVIERKGLTLVGVTVSNLDARYGGIQLELPLERRSRSALDRALDELRERFGTGAIIRAALLGRGSELSPALLADEAARRRD
jgi:DNA polymerase IV